MSGFKRDIPYSTPTPQGDIVCVRREFGHFSEVELLKEPRKVGAGLRFFRLWNNGTPLLGGQWHYTLLNALAEAEYRLRNSYVSRIEWLERRVRALESEAAKVSDAPAQK